MKCAGLSVRDCSAHFLKGVKQMKALDRLIIKAKRSSIQFSFGMVYPSRTEPGKWEARGDLWNYIPHDKPGCKSDSVFYTCDSVDEAVSKLEALSEQYPNNRDVTILVDNIVE